MKYIEAPNEVEPATASLFLAGGITGCPDWQSELAELLRESSLTVFNPRRANFPIHDQNAALGQITWEHRALRRADAVAFWFPCETLCPIVLYELGAWSMTDKPIFVGVHPRYERKQDVLIQTELVRPSVHVTFSLEHLAKQILQWGVAEKEEPCTG